MDKALKNSIRRQDQKLAKRGRASTRDIVRRFAFASSPAKAATSGS